MPETKRGAEGKEDRRGQGINISGVVQHNTELVKKSSSACLLGL